MTAPSGGANVVASANDFATQVFQDPWDMNERSDFGWWLNSVDFPYAGFSTTSFGAGVFSGTISADPNLWLLETNLPNLPADRKERHRLSDQRGRIPHRCHPDSHTG